MSVFLCYELTNDSNDGDKDLFYEKLQSIIPKRSGKDLIILMRDLNAKIDWITSSMKVSWGEMEWLGETNGSGYGFSNIYAFSKMVIDVLGMLNPQNLLGKWLNFVILF